jgi:arylsulfatase A-like enzyme
MMRKAIVLFLLITQLTVQAQQQPNIIVFLIDDMGWQDTSVPFWTKKTLQNNVYRTPNMEKLAQEGMKFTNAYAAPVCTPTRSSMLSGLNSAHLKITNWTSPWKNNNTDVPDNDMVAANWNMNGLSPIPGIENTYYATPFPILLKEAGYYTIHVGKAHWGSMGTPGSNPINMGFMAKRIMAIWQEKQPHKPFQILKSILEQTRF